MEQDSAHQPRGVLNDPTTAPTPAATGDGRGGAGPLALLADVATGVAIEAADEDDMPPPLIAFPREREPPATAPKSRSADLPPQTSPTRTPGDHLRSKRERPLVRPSLRLSRVSWPG